MRGLKQALQQPAPPGEILVCVASAPLLSLDTFLHAPLPGEPLLWRAPSEGWSFAGVGAAVRLTTRGPSRFADLQEEAQALLQSLTVRAHAEAQHPSVRFFGGASFQDNDSAAPWGNFAGADFILPRWCYARSEQQAFLSCAVTSPSEQATLLAELQALELFFASPHRGNTPTSPPRSVLEEQPRREWAALVQSALRGMRAGSFSKAVLARCSRLTQDEPFSIPQVAQRMLSSYQNCTQFIMSRAGASFIGSTPERLVSVSKMQVEIDALAGSTPRVSGEEEQASLALLQDDKERREHQHVIQGIEEALRPFCAPIQRAAQPQIRLLPNVLHLHTPLKATLSAPTHILSLVEALHPTPAVCGLPREAARQWIMANEPFSRGWYAAPVGYFDAQGEGAFYVAIRSALLEESRAWLYAGAGLVEGSEPEREYDETAAKQRPMLSALGVL